MKPSFFLKIRFLQKGHIENMQILHTTTFMDQEFASDAHIFSVNQISKDTASDLLYAQMVVEAKWLGDFPVFAFPAPADELKRCTPLFEDVKLVYPDDWGVIDEVNAFLINNKMYHIMQAAGCAVCQFGVFDIRGADEVVRDGDVCCRGGWETGMKSRATPQAPCCSPAYCDLVEAIEKLRREHRFARIELSIRNHEIIHADLKVETNVRVPMRKTVASD